MGTIVITSRLGEDFREDLEHMMFFNAKQHKAEADIKRCVELFGVPEITTERGYLRVCFGSSNVAQTLYSVDRTEFKDVLVGAIVFVRDTLEDISILHIAIANQYILRGPVVTARLVWDLIRQVINSASLIHGVKNVKLAYTSSTGKSKSSITSIPVKSHAYKRIKGHKTAPCPDQTVTCYEYQHCYECIGDDVSKNRKPLIH